MWDSLNPAERKVCLDSEEDTCQAGSQKESLSKRGGGLSHIQEAWEDSSGPVAGGLMEEKHLYLGPRRQLLLLLSSSPHSSIVREHCLGGHLQEQEWARLFLPCEKDVSHECFLTNSLQGNLWPDTGNRGELCWSMRASRMWPTPTSIYQSYWSIRTPIDLHMKEWALEVGAPCHIYLYCLLWPS